MHCGTIMDSRGSGDQTQYPFEVFPLFAGPIMPDFYGTFVWYIMHKKLKHTRGTGDRTDDPSVKQLPVPDMCRGIH